VLKDDEQVEAHTVQRSQKTINNPIPIN
jgi:hypothetical protein